MKQIIDVCHFFWIRFWNAGRNCIFFASSGPLLLAPLRPQPKHRGILHTKRIMSSSLRRGIDLWTQCVDDVSQPAQDSDNCTGNCISFCVMLSLLVCGYNMLLVCITGWTMSRKSIHGPECMHRFEFDRFYSQSVGCLKNRDIVSIIKSHISEGHTLENSSYAHSLCCYRRTDDPSFPTTQISQKNSETVSGGKGEKHSYREMQTEMCSREKF